MLRLGISKSRESIVDSGKSDMEAVVRQLMETVIRNELRPFVDMLAALRVDIQEMKTIGEKTIPQRFSVTLEEPRNNSVDGRYLSEKDAYREEWRTKIASELFRIHKVNDSAIGGVYTARFKQYEQKTGYRAKTATAYDYIEGSPSRKIHTLIDEGHAPSFYQMIVNEPLPAALKVTAPKRKRGRPKGSRNRKSIVNK